MKVSNKENKQETKKIKLNNLKILISKNQVKPQKVSQSQKNKELLGINIAVKNVSMLIEIKIRRLVYVLYLEIKDELIQVMKVVKHVDVQAVLNKILFTEAKILNIIQKIKRNKVRKNNKHNYLRQETVVVKIV